MLKFLSKLHCDEEEDGQYSFLKQGDIWGFPYSQEFRCFFQRKNAGKKVSAFELENASSLDMLECGRRV